MRSVRIALPLAMTLLLVSASVRAEDPRKAEAETLFNEARKLHDRDRFAEALEKLEQSYRVYPSPNTLVGIAREEQLLKRNVAAIRHLREAVKQPMLSPKNVPATKERIAELEQLVGRVEVHGKAGLRVDVAGVKGRLPLDEPVDVEPGSVVVTGDDEDAHASITVTAVAGKVVVAELETKPPAAPATPPPVRTTIEPPPEPVSTWTAGKTAGVVLGGAAVVALGVGIGMRISASSKADDADAAAKDPAIAGGCAGVSSTACDRVRSDAESERDRKNLSTGLFLGAAGLAAAGLATYFFWPSRPRSSAATVVPVFGREGGGVVGRFAF